MHSGGPGSNVEVLLKGWDAPEDDEGEEGGEGPQGEVWVRGPGVVGSKEGQDEKG